MNSSAAIAVIADVHGNRWALEAVLKRIRELGVVRVLNLGDSLYGPLDPSGTADLLMQTNIVSVMGNEDRILIEPPTDSWHSPSLGFTLSRLHSDQLDWLRALPRTQLVGDSILMCHGTPERDDEYLFWDIGPGGAVQRSPEMVGRRLNGCAHLVVLAGHDHKPSLMRDGCGQLVANPGSVGLPAYVDHTLPAHVMENGSPHARFAVLLNDDGRWWMEHETVGYDWLAAARTAGENGRSDWARWLLTGRV